MYGKESIKNHECVASILCNKTKLYKNKYNKQL